MIRPNSTAGRLAAPAACKGTDRASSERLSRESVDAYDGFLDSLDAYEKDVSNLDVRKD